MEDVKILIVDDEPDILEFLGYNLEKEGFEVHTATNGMEALQLAGTIKPHLAILDVMMPEMDGIETCERMRQNKELESMLIVFLTARGEDYSQIAGFEAGADDYVTKPIKPKVLVSRVYALLKRFRAPLTQKTDSNYVEIGTLKIDSDQYLITLDGEEIFLPKKEFELLSLLASRPGKVFTRDDIYHSIWGDEIIVGDRTIDVHIRKIREKIGDAWIKTIKGVGYRLQEPGESD